MKYIERYLVIEGSFEDCVEEMLEFHIDHLSLLIIPPESCEYFQKCNDKCNH